MQHSQATELSMFIVSCALFLGYHAWLFVFRAHFKRHRRNRFNLWNVNRQARGAWAVEICSNTNDALHTYAVQTLRNSITASSFLATACSLIAVTGLGNAILDVNKVNRLDSLARSDPALHGGPSIFSATTKLALGEIVILFSFLCLTQSIRLQVHMAFYSKNIPSERNQQHFYETSVLVAMSNQGATCFTLGMRAFYAFIPLLLWNAGPTWMLVTTVLEVISLVFTDSIPLPRHMPYEGQDKKTEAEGDIEMGSRQAEDDGGATLGSTKVASNAHCCQRLPSNGEQKSQNKGPLGD